MNEVEAQSAAAVGTAPLKPPCRNKPPWGRRNASVVSWITFWWVFDLLKVGRKRDLIEDDIDEIDETDSSKYLLNKFLIEWNKELDKNGDNANLAMAILHMIGLKRFIFTISTFTIYFVLNMANITFMQQILKFFENSNHVTFTQALLHCSGITICSIIITYHIHWLFYNTTNMGTNVRQVMTSVILYKSLKISANSVPSSQVMNLMSTDAQRFEMLLRRSPLSLMIPYLIPGIIYLCYVVDTWFPIFGLSLYFLMIPCQLYFSKKFGKLRDQAVVHTDQRLKIVNEMLVGCLAMKMYCWEKALSKSVYHSRKNEMKYITRAAMINAFNQAVYFSSQTLIALIIFLPYYYSVGSLQSSIIYPILTFFAIFKLMTLYAIPETVQLLSEVRVSLRRIRQFLLIPEISHNRILEAKNITKDNTLESILQSNDSNRDKPMNNNAFVKIENGSFSWDAVPNLTLKRVLSSKKAKNEALQRASVASSSRIVLPAPVPGATSTPKAATPDAVDVDLMPATMRHELFNINLKIEKNSNAFVAIVGKVGSGKSSLLSAILGECPFSRNHSRNNNKGNNNNVMIQGSIGYSRQKPWILSGANVKENITFGETFDEEWYKQVIYSCALTHDLNELAHGDETIIGESGVNLSGGQKTRISLARAVYKKADILLLDDPLSALDSFVAKHIFDHVLDSQNGISKNSIRILVTHSTQFAGRVDSVIIMENGTITHQDSLENLNKIGINIKTMIDENKSNEDNTNENENEFDMSEEKETKEDKNDFYKMKLRPKGNKEEESMLVTRAKKESIIKKETIAKGNVSLESYVSLFYVNENYWKSPKWKYTIQMSQILLLMTLMFGSQICLTYSEYYLGVWANKSTKSQSHSKYIDIFIILVIVTLASAQLRAVIFFKVILRSARYLHDKMFNGILYAPMRVFESNLIGTILNRFSKDQWVVDEQLPLTTFDAVQLIAHCAMSIFAAALTSPYVVLLLIPCIAVFGWTVKYFIASSRTLKRLQATSRSHVFSLFGIIYAGLDTIRVHNKESIMLQRGLNMIDVNSRMTLMYTALTRWSAVTLDVMTALLTGATAFVCVFLAYYANFSSSAVGLVLTYMITLSGYLQRTVRQVADLESFMTSTERIVEYSKIMPEGMHDDNEKEKNTTIITDNWPSKGEIEIKHLYCKYRKHLDFVLKDICISIKSCEKIGIVGRTGSGKSSLFLSLFRLLESDSGSIEIDAINIKSLTLHQLREKLSIIPQTPVLFSETIRYNIDPLNQHSDNEIYEALRTVSLYDMIINLPNGLSTMMAEHGSNFSVGESQLICVARCLLKPNLKILFVDEATSSVDPNTDALIQSILKTKFANTTILTIAHRIQTVLHCDRILVLQSGTVVECDTPTNLLANHDSVFSAMYQQAINVRRHE